MAVAERFPGIARLQRGTVQSEVPVSAQIDDRIGSGIEGPSRLERRQTVEHISDQATIRQIEEKILSIRQCAYQSIGKEPVIESGRVKGVCFDAPSYNFHDESHQVLLDNKQDTPVGEVAAVLNGRVTLFERGNRRVEHVTFCRLRPDGQIITAGVTIEEEIDSHRRSKGIRRLACTEDTGVSMARIEVTVRPSGDDSIRDAKLIDYTTTPGEQILSRRGQFSMRKVFNELDAMTAEISGREVSVEQLAALQELAARRTPETAIELPVTTDTQQDRLQARLSEVEQMISNAQLVLANFEQNYKGYLDSHPSERKDIAAYVADLERQEGILKTDLEELTQASAPLLEVKHVAPLTSHEGRRRHRAQGFGRKVIASARLASSHH